MWGMWGSSRKGWLYACPTYGRPSRACGAGRRSGAPSVLIRAGAVSLAIWAGALASFAPATLRADWPTL